MSAVFFLIAAFIFLLTSLGSWKWSGDFEPVTLGLFFIALGLFWGPVWAFVASKRAVP